MRYEALQAVPATEINHGLHEHFPADICHPNLTPELTKPVFAMPADLDLTEAVAVVWRNSERKPVDGGLFGVTEDMQVVRLALVDAARGINTDDNPAWIAFGLNMTLGELIVKGMGPAKVLPWSILDIDPGDSDGPLGRLPTPGRKAVLAICPAFFVNREA